MIRQFAPKAFGRTIVGAVLQRSWLAWAGFFLVIVGVRLCLVADYGSSLPMYDQWEGEGATLFKPWRDGTLRVVDFVAPHNEHRMLPSKLLALGLLRLNGQWDARLQMTVNAILCGFIALTFGLAATRLLGRSYRTAILAVFACWSSFPYAWENTTWSFQSSFFFLLFFSLAAIWGLALKEVFSLGWWMGVLAALIAGVSMGSGALAMGAVIGLEILRTIKTRAFPARRMVNVVVCGAIVLLFLYLRVEVPGHAPFRATSFELWASCFGRSLSWPFAGAWGWVVVYLPLGLLLVSYFREETGSSWVSSKATEALLALGGWVILQAGAIAYYRGAQDLVNVPSRYMDILALGAVANCLTVLLCFGRDNFRRASGQLVAGAGLIWFTVLLGWAINLSRASLPSAVEKARVARLAEKSVRAFVATGDRSLLQNFTPWNLPYPWLDPLAELLIDPAIRGILPAVVAPPLSLAPAAGSSGFERDIFSVGPPRPGEHIWSSPGKNDVPVGLMRSEIIFPRLPFLAFEVHGSFGPGMSLKGRDEATGREEGWRRFAWIEGWGLGYVPVGAGGVRIIAKDDDNEGSFAFWEPREMGRFSYWTEAVLRKSRWLLLYGVAMLLAFGMASLVSWARSFNSAGKPGAVSSVGRPR